MKDSWVKGAMTIASGGSNADAGKVAGVTARTIQRWRADEVQFADRIEDLRSQMLTEAAGLLAHTTTAAVLKLAILQKVSGAQNQAIASIQREWRIWSDALLRIHTPEGIDPSKWLATLST